jgi:hypothetical protein
LVATELRLFADYFQIHVFDEGSKTDFGDLWTSQTVRDGLAAGPAHLRRSCIGHQGCLDD